MKAKINFIKHIRLWGVILLIALAVIILVINIINAYRDFNNCAKKMRIVYVAEQKEDIKQEVLRVVDMIEYHHSLSQKQTKKNIKECVCEAYDIEKDIKNELFSIISRVRFGKEGYIFINRFNGDALVTNGKIIGGKKKLWELFNKDPEKTKELFEKEYKAAQKPEGDYIYYSFVKLTNPDKESPKASFVFGIPKWKWIVGAGVYLDDVEKEISLIKARMYKQIKMSILYFSIVTFGIVAVFLFLFNNWTQRLKNDFELFSSFFDRAAISNEPVDMDKIKFSEFAQMAENANKMLSDKVKAQQDLLDEKEQLFVTIRSIGDGVITTDKAGNVVLMNTIAEKLTGWSIESARGKPLSETFNIIDENTRSTVINPVKEALKKGCIVGLANHTILISKDGSEYNIADSAAPIRDANSKIRGVVLVFRDVTEKQRTEKELLKTKRLESIGLLAGGIAHDFNNILTGIFGNIELAKLNIPEKHPAYTFLDTAYCALEKATHLTKQLLTFAKGGDPILEAVNLKSVVQSTVDFNLSGSNVKAEFDLSDDLWQIKADKGQMSQVIANLIINAKEAMPEGGLLYIKAENIENPLLALKGFFVKLTIKDSGIGIPKEFLEKIFDPYFSTKQAGSGLGLSTVHSIVVKHNGYISVNSIIGTGTTFTIYIPTEKHLCKYMVTTHKSYGQNSNSTSAHILIMDDEVMVRSVIEAMLDSCGYKVDFATDGKDAIEKYIAADKSGQPFDIVIMDLTIPGGMGGEETIKKLLLINPDAKVIVASGYSTDSIMANYNRYGFKGRIVKPFQLDELRNELIRVMKLG